MTMNKNDTQERLLALIENAKGYSPSEIINELRKIHSELGVINAFPGYKYISALDSEDHKAHNMYRGVDVGFGGYVYSNPGIYYNVTCFDVSGMHPASAIALNAFGEYTQRYKEIVDIRQLIKHKEFDTAKTLLDGALAKHLTDESKAKELSKALKIAVNSVYGLTSASFENPFRDDKNINNIVALRGALFMKTLQDILESMGVKVIHIKTDSIKVVNPTEEISQFIFDFGKEYGYLFEIEHVFDRICLVDKAQYIAKLSGDDPENPGAWTATGDKFQVPYVFKTLFSKEPIEFKDMCERKEVKSAMYLDFSEGKADDISNYRFVGKVGLFCPIKKGCGGACLMRENEATGKMGAVVGTKGYFWMEADDVKALGKEDCIDRSYYKVLVDDAVDTISNLGDYEAFVS